VRIPPTQQPRYNHGVIPAEAGIQFDRYAVFLVKLDSRLRGNDVVNDGGRVGRLKAPSPGCLIGIRPLPQRER